MDKNSLIGNTAFRYITDSTVALHCCKTYAMGNPTRCEIVTPENIILKRCTRD